MLKMKMVSMFMLLLVFSASIPITYGLNEEKIAISSPERCKGGISDKEIQHIAKQVNRFNISEQMDACLQQLSQEIKVKIFEAMAEHKGISAQELREEAERMNQATEGTNSPSSGISWVQPIERTYWYNIWTSVAPYTWWSSQYYCDSDSDTDYIFKFSYSSPITNPDGLRTWSNTNAFGGWNVQLMLEYYQATIGGLKGIGNTSSSFAKICIGNSGYSSAGGYIAIMSALRLDK